MRRVAWVLLWTAVVGLQFGVVPEVRADLVGQDAPPSREMTPPSSATDSLASREAFLTPEEAAYFQAKPEAVRIAAAQDPVPIEGFWWEAALGFVALTATGIGLWIFLGRND